MTTTTDANGRQRTPTDAPRPLRETVADALYMWRGGLTDASASYVVPFERLNDHYKEEFHSEANAAIAAMVDALLSETAVEAGADTAMGCRNCECRDERNSRCRASCIEFTRNGMMAALRRIGAV